MRSKTIVVSTGWARPMSPSTGGITLASQAALHPLEFEYEMKSGVGSMANGLTTLVPGYSRCPIPFADTDAIRFVADFDQAIARAGDLDV